MQFAFRSMGAELNARNDGKAGVFFSLPEGGLDAANGIMVGNSHYPEPSFSRKVNQFFRLPAPVGGSGMEMQINTQLINIPHNTLNGNRLAAFFININQHAGKLNRASGR